MEDHVACLLSPPTAWCFDAMMAAVWLLDTALLGLAAWRWSRRLFPLDPLPGAIAHTLVLAWGTVVLAAFALGTAGFLCGPVLMGTVAVLSVAALVADAAWVGRRPHPVEANAESAAAPSLIPGRERPWHIVWGVVFAFWIGHVITGGLLKFPSDWDSLNYHLPMVVQWLHARSLYAPDCFHWSYPGNNELITFWIVAPFSGDFLCALTNLPATALLACAAVELGRRLGVSHSLAHLAALAIVCNFVVLYQLVDQENDVAVCALFFAALLYTHRHVESAARGDLCLAVATLGLLAGIKFYALGYAALASAAWVLLATIKHGPRRGTRATLAAAGGVLLFAGYWYIRNIIVTGSPLYPRGMFGSPDVLAQLHPDVEHTSFIGNRRPELPGLFLSAVWHMTGPCQLVALLLLPLSFAMLLWRGRARFGATIVFRRLFALVLAGSLLVLLITPFAVEDNPGTLNQLHWRYCPVRYGWCLLSSATLALAVVASDALGALARTGTAGRSLAIGLEFVIGMAVVTRLARLDARVPLVWMDTVLVTVNLILLATIVAIVALQWPRLKRVCWAAVATACLIAAVPVWAALSHRWHHDFAPHYERTLTAGCLTALDGAGDLHGKVCVMTFRCYPYFGAARQCRVCQPVSVASPEALLDYLKSANAAAIVTSTVATHQGWRCFRGFSECRAMNPPMFPCIRAGGVTALYRVEPSGATPLEDRRD